MRYRLRAEIRDNIGSRMLIRFIVGAVATMIPLLFFQILWPEFVIMAAISGGLITASHKLTQKRWIPYIAMAVGFFVAVVFATTFAFAPLIAWISVCLADEVSKRFIAYDDES